jgi:hypothetical protein
MNMQLVCPVALCNKGESPAVCLNHNRPANIEGLFDPHSKSVGVVDRAVKAGSITVAGGGSLHTGERSFIPPI